MDEIPMAPSPADNDQQPDPAKVDYQEGMRHLENGDFSMAANAFHNARIGYEEAGNEEGQANANFRLGEVCQESGEHEKALAYYEAAAAICKKYDDLMSLLAIRKKKVLCYRGLKKYDQAITDYLGLLDTYQAMNNPRTTVETLISMGETFEEMGERQKAADACNTAADIHDRYKHIKQAKELRQRAENVLQA